MPSLPLAFSPDIPLALPVAVLWLAGLYGLPALTCWLALRKKQRRAALLAGMLAAAIAGYTTVVEWPRTGADVWFWLFVAALPLLLSAGALGLAFRLRARPELER